MTKITTADCRKFLATDANAQALVQNRYDISCADPNEPEETEFYRKVHVAAQKTKNWLRRTKYKIGSKTDTHGSDCGCYGGSDYANTDWKIQQLGFDPTGGVVREFNLEPDTEIVIALLEKDGKLFVLDDLSD